jgi:hypothetical protein
MHSYQSAWTMLRSSGHFHPSLSRNILTHFIISSSSLFFHPNTSISLHRFLRARKFDVAKAKAMLLAAEQWRKDDKIDELVQCVQLRRSLRVSVNRAIRAET